MIPSAWDRNTDSCRRRMGFVGIAGRAEGSEGGGGTPVPLGMHARLRWGWTVRLSADGLSWGLSRALLRPSHMSLPTPHQVARYCHPRAHRSDTPSTAFPDACVAVIFLWKPFVLCLLSAPLLWPWSHARSYEHSSLVQLLMSHVRAGTVSRFPHPSSMQPYALEMLR